LGFTKICPIDTVTGHGLGSRGVGVRVPAGVRFFSSPHCPDQFWGPPSFLSSGYWGLFGVNWPGHEADHSLPTSSEVKTTWV
jgi:hypothetical protein